MQLHGLYAVGITSRVIGDLRRLTGCWSHLTHVTNSELCSSLQLSPPIDDLQVRWHQHLTRQLAARQSLDAADVVLRFDEYSHWQQLQDTLACWYHTQTLAVPTPNVHSWPCPHCPETFAHRQTMRAHVRKEHSDLDPKYTFVPLRDALNGMPQCRHCLLKLNDNLTMRYHIENHWCYAFDPDAQELQPLCQRPGTQELIRQQAWTELLQDEELCRSLVHNCGICQHWCAQSNSLAAHLKKRHGEIYLPSVDLRPAIAAKTRISQKHCTVCAQEVHQQHTCPVVMQLALLCQAQQRPDDQLNTSDRAKDADQKMDSPSPTTGQGTGSNKRKSPLDGAYSDADLEPPAVLFPAERDCYGGRNECCHCRQTFGDHIGLRRHID